MSAAQVIRGMDVFEAIRLRRSINFFDPARQVPEDTIRELLEVSNLAPSSFNLQPWKTIAVRDPERKKALRRCAMNQPKAEEAPVVLIMIADPAALEENMEAVLESWRSLGYMEEEKKPAMRQMMAELYGTVDSPKRALFAVKNTALFAMTLMLAAKAMGLETHPMDGIDEECIKREFGIGERCHIPMLVAVGYLRPQAELLPRAYRRGIGDFARFV